jgi:hypothetical protein
MPSNFDLQRGLQSVGVRVQQTHEDGGKDGQNDEPAIRLSIILDLPSLLSLGVWNLVLVNRGLFAPRGLQIVWASERWEITLDPEVADHGQVIEFPTAHLFRI